MDLGQILTPQEREEQRQRRIQREQDQKVIILRGKIAKLRKSMADGTATAAQTAETLRQIKQLKKELLVRIDMYN